MYKINQSLVDQMRSNKSIVVITPKIIPLPVEVEEELDDLGAVDTVRDPAVEAERIIQDARETGKLIDATYGRRTRAVIITDSWHVLLSSVQPETVANRLHVKDIPQEESHEQ